MNVHSQVTMADQEESVREVEALMAEGFGGPQPNPRSHENEVIVAVNREVSVEVPVGFLSNR